MLLPADLSSRNCAAKRLQVRVRVPDLPFDIDLNKSNTTFYQSAGHQASLAVRGRDFLVEPVHLLGFRAFLREIQRIGGRQLHSRRKFEAGNTSIKFRVSHPLLLVGFVHAPPEGAFRLDKRKRQFLLRFEIQQRRAFRTESSALVDRRQPSCLPALDTVYRQLFRIIKNDIRRKILVICSQTIYDPSAQGWAAGERSACMHQIERRFMIEMLSKHRTNERNVVGALAQMRE